ncbi:MAG: RidA family protein [Euryarchaeota archaeon]|nr:RidA family protein [Euryarchaeota archaeon]
MSAESKLQALKVLLPKAPKAMATYSSWVRSGNLLFIAGQGPMVDGLPKFKGKVGATVTLAQGQESARLACLNALAVVKEALGSLDKVKRVVKANVYVACTNDFTDQPKVANGATELLRDLWGEAGLPARAAVGVNVLPMDIPVELELVVET